MMGWGIWSSHIEATSILSRGIPSFVFVARNVALNHESKSTLPATSSRTFGELLSSSFKNTMPTLFPVASCPCCSFIGGDLFLPQNNGEGENRTISANMPEADENETQLHDVMSPVDAWKLISVNQNNHRVLLVDTHGHPHLQRHIQYADTCSENELENDTVVSLTCAVSPVDWSDTLEYASQSSFILPAIGIHPWYLNDILIENGQQKHVNDFLRWDWLDDLEHHLSQHPNLIVGEIGLCKMAKFVREFPKEYGGKATALQLQKIVFQKQIALAAKWSRPVTIHCVNMHGALMEVLREILQDAKAAYTRCKDSDSNETGSLQTFVRSRFPPSIAMHSFTGTDHHVQEILKFEEEVMNPDQVHSNKREVRKKKKPIDTDDATEQSSNNDTNKDCLFYFGFSHAVNHIMCTSDKARRKGIEAIRSVPSERLIAESDVHAAADVTLGTAGAIAYIASARGEQLSDISESTTINGLRYLGSVSLGSQVTDQLG